VWTCSPYHGGFITDSLDISPGEIKLRLDPTGSGTEVTLLCDPHPTANSAFRALEHLPPNITDTLDKTIKYPHLRTYAFTNIRDLHLFQTLLTGFTPLFDATPQSLTISRVIPLIRMHKLWEAPRPRIQILSKRDQSRPSAPPISQLLVFFDDGFAHASAMAFELRVTDTYAKVEEKGKEGKKRWGVRFVDAKFPLPRPRSKEEVKGDVGPATTAVAEGRWRVEDRFVCPTRLEYAGEHDDLTVWFAGEEVRDECVRCLPAEVNVKRGLTLRRKI